MYLAGFITRIYGDCLNRDTVPAIKWLSTLVSKEYTASIFMVLGKKFKFLQNTGNYLAHKTVP